jgi:hypothetical protein
MESIKAIGDACEFVLNNNLTEAKEIIEKNYKHTFIKYEERLMSSYEKLNIFFNDGFIDRYTGKKLLFPNVLKILSIKLGETFPFHKNWKMSDCHIAYWEYFPTYDHVIPIARGGKDILENIVTTSMKMNSIKSNFLMKEIGLELREKGNINNWNGMLSWYLRYVEKDKKILEDKYILRWHNALKKYMNVNKINFE